MTEKRPEADKPKIIGWPGYYHRMSLGPPGSFLREAVTMIVVCALGLAGVAFVVWLLRTIARAS